MSSSLFHHHFNHRRSRGVQLAILLLVSSLSLILVMESVCSLVMVVNASAITGTFEGESNKLAPNSNSSPKVQVLYRGTQNEMGYEKVLPAVSSDQMRVPMTSLISDGSASMSSTGSGQQNAAESSSSKMLTWIIFPCIGLSLVVIALCAIGVIKWYRRRHRLNAMDGVEMQGMGTCKIVPPIATAAVSAPPMLAIKTNPEALVPAVIDEKEAHVSTPYPHFDFKPVQAQYFRKTSGTGILPVKDGFSHELHVPQLTIKIESGEYEKIETKPYLVPSKSNPIPIPVASAKLDLSVLPNKSRADTPMNKPMPMYDLKPSPLMDHMEVIYEHRMMRRASIEDKVV